MTKTTFEIGDLVSQIHNPDKTGIVDGFLNGLVAVRWAGSTVGAATNPTSIQLLPGSEPPSPSVDKTMQKITVKNALIKSAEIYADVTTTHVTLVLELCGGTMKIGPYKHSTPLVRGVLHVAHTRSWSDLPNHAVRVQFVDDQVVCLGHFLTDDWVNLEDPIAYQGRNLELSDLPE